MIAWSLIGLCIGSKTPNTELGLLRAFEKDSYPMAVASKLPLMFSSFTGLLLLARVSVMVDISSLPTIVVLLPKSSWIWSILTLTMSSEVWWCVSMGLGQWCSCTRPTGRKESRVLSFHCMVMNMERLICQTKLYQSLWTHTSALMPA